MSLQSRVRRHSGHGRPRRARHGDRGRPALGAKLLVRADGSTEGGAGRRRSSTAPRVEAAEELMWAERSEMREVGDVDAVRRRRRSGAAADRVRRGRLRRRAVPPRPGRRLAALRVRPALAVRHARALPRRRGGAWPPGRTRRSRGSAGSTAPPTSRSSPTTRSSTTPRSRSRCARTPPYVGAMGSRRAQAQRRERLLAAGRRRGAARAHRRADRARPRRGEPGGDRAVDHGRGRRRCGTAATAAACRRPAGGSTRWALDRRPRARGGRRHALRRRPSSSPSSDGVPLLEHALRAMTASRPSGASWWCSASGADEIAAGVDLHGAEPLVCSRWEEGQSASLACGLAALG